MDINKFKAGVSKLDITPPLGTLINGDFVPHYANHIHDRLFVKSLVLTDGSHTVALIIVDICAMKRLFLDEVKHRIFECTGIKTEDILIASTHTHAAGAIESLLLGAADLPYRQSLPEIIVRSVDQAKNNMVPAKIAFGGIDVPEHVVCRRYIMDEGYKAYNPVTKGYDLIKTNPVGDEDKILRRASEVDASLNFLAVQGLDGRWISLLGNYSMHYVGDWPAGSITADYFGVFSNHVAKLLSADDDFVAIMSNGTSGEANIWDFLKPDRYPKQPFEKSQLIGEDLAEKVVYAMESLHWEHQPEVKSIYQLIPVKLRKPNQEELNAALQTVVTTDYSKVEECEDAMDRIYAREQVLLNEYADEQLFPLQLIKLGTGQIGGLGGEFFAETGLALKKENTNSKYFTITLANDYVGYVPPKHELIKGGYETWRCRTSYFEPDAEDKIRKGILRMMGQI